MPVNHIANFEILNGVIAEKADNLSLVYEDEDRCHKALRKFKLQSRVKCENCNSGDLYWELLITQFQCKACGFRSGTKAGTILENLDLPVSYLFISIHVLLKYNGEAALALLQQITGYTNSERLSVLLERIGQELSLDKQILLLISFIESVDNDVEYLI